MAEQHPNDVPLVKYGSRERPEVQPRWWLSDTPARDMVSVAQQLDQEQRWRRRVNTVFGRLYTGRQMRNVYDYRAAAPFPGEDPFGLGTRLGLNVVQAVIDTIAAKIAKNTPRSFLLTEDGTWSLQRQAKLLMRFLDGLRLSQDVAETNRRAFIDACTFGSGIVKVSPDYEEAKVCVERVIPDSLIINDAEAVGGKPRTIYQKHLMHRAVLEELYAGGKGEAALKRGRAISEAPGWDAAKDVADARSEMVWVYEGWSLRGKHQIAIDHADGDLMIEPWNKPHPFAWMRWRTDIAGIWGIGIAEDLLGIQMEINKLLQRLQEAHHLMAVLRIFTKPGARIQKNKITNEMGTILECEEAPTFHAGTTLPPGVYQHLWDLYEKAFQIIGVSMMDAAGTKDPGVTAAVAIQEMRDIGTERFVLAGKAFERFSVDEDRLVISTAREMYTKGKEVRIKAPGTKFIETITWSKVNLEEDQYELKPWPTSILPATPAGRLQRVQDLYQAGLIPDRETALSLLDAPDLEGTLSLQLSAIDDIKRILELITDEGEYEPPEPFINLDLAARMAQSTFLKMRRLKGFPEVRLDNLIRFGDACRDLAAEAAPAAPPPMPVQPGAPGMPAPAGAPALGPVPGQAPMAAPGLPSTPPPPLQAPMQ